MHEPAGLKYHAFNPSRKWIRKDAVPESLKIIKREKEIRMLQLDYFVNNRQFTM